MEILTELVICRNGNFFSSGAERKKANFQPAAERKMFYDSNNSGERETGACDVPRLLNGSSGMKFA
jgi:hypothetical protein